MKLPAGPTTLPLIQLIQWIADPLSYLETCAKRYGDNFTARLGSAFSPVVFLSAPQAIQAVFTADPKLFDVGKTNEALRPWLGANSLLLLDGEAHRQQRRLLTPAFHGERMQTYGEPIRQIALEVSNCWTTGKPFSLRKSLQDITLRVILQAVFGLSAGARYDQLRQMLEDLLELTDFPLGSSIGFFPFLQKDLGAWSLWGRTKRLLQEIDERLYAEIRERRENADWERTDILSLMMTAHNEQGEGMTDVELRDEMLTLLLAGHETTTTASTWAFYWIHQLPTVLKRLRQELEQLRELPEPMQIVQLPYLSAVCQEALRLYPPLPLAFIRILKAPLQVVEYKFEPGTMLAPCIYLAHQREDVYPQPKQFLPERFLQRQYSSYEYLPFGGGNRRCIGAALALFEMKLVLATLLSHYQLALAENRPVKPHRRTYLTLAPTGEVKMVMTG